MSRLERLLMVVLLVVAALPSSGGLVPDDILLVVNNNPAVAAASRGVAEYYRTERGVPQSHVYEVTTTSLEYISPEDFATQIYKPLMEHLQTHFGADPEDPASCRIKCIVLCYGIPVRITSSTRLCAVDAALTMLFEHAPWGRAAMTVSTGSYAWYGSTVSPYADTDETNYLTARGEKPTDFSEFRASAFDEVEESPPNYSIVRFTDATHAIAGGEQGMLYGGELAGGEWTWTPALDWNKDFVAHTIKWHGFCTMLKKEMECSQGEQMLALRPKVCYNCAVRDTWQSSTSPIGGYAL
jgi:hypothetical protein